MTDAEVRKSIEESLAESLYGNPFSVISISDEGNHMHIVKYSTPAYLPGKTEPEETICIEWMMD